MERLTEKLDEVVNCPHCNIESLYTFHVTADSLTCHHCDKTFDIEILVKSITIKARK